MVCVERSLPIKDVFWCLLIDYLTEQLFQIHWQWRRHSVVNIHQWARRWCCCQYIRAAKTRCCALEHFGCLMHALLLLSLSSGWRSLTVQAKPAAHPPAEARQCIYSKLNNPALSAVIHRTLTFYRWLVVIAFYTETVSFTMCVWCPSVWRFVFAEFWLFATTKHTLLPCVRLFCSVSLFFSQQLQPHYVIPWLLPTS